MATAHGAAHDHSHDDHDHHTPTGWRRYVYSTNHKDIGTMYLVFAIFAALIGATFSVIMRLELLQPGVQYLQRPGRHAQRPSVEHRRHGARPDHGVLRRHAGADRRVRQLVRAADDRRARHGLPAHEQHQLLAAAAGLPAAARCRPSSAAASAPAGRSIRRSRSSRARAWTSPSSRCISPAPRRSWAPSTSSPPSSTCARRA